MKSVRGAAGLYLRVSSKIQLGFHITVVVEMCRAKARDAVQCRAQIERLNPIVKGVVAAFQRRHQLAGSNAVHHDG